MTNKKVIYGVIGVIILIVVGAVIMATMNSDNTNNSSTTSTSTTSSNENTAEESRDSEPTVSETNAEALAKSGKPQQCSFDYSGPNGTAKATIYSDGNGKSRMTIGSIVTDQGNTGETNMIIRDNKYYNWITTNGQTVGFSGDLGSQSNNSTNQTPSQTSPNQNFSMKCSSWEVDESKFVVPTDVNFSGLNFNLNQ